MSASVVGLCGGLHVGGSVQRIGPEVVPPAVTDVEGPWGGGVALVRAALIVGEEGWEEEGEASKGGGERARLKDAMEEGEGSGQWEEWFVVRVDGRDRPGRSRARFDQGPAEPARARVQLYASSCCSIETGHAARPLRKESSGQFYPARRSTFE